MTNYTGLMRATLIVGLGNSGEKYAKTRHNLGARVVEAWAKEYPEGEVLLPQPGVFMNDFGTIVPRDREVVLVHDDIELSLGKIKFVSGGSARGHKGVKSVQEHLGTKDIPRLRLGIGRPPTGVEVDDYVLGRFTPAEEEKLAQLWPRIIKTLASLVGSSEGSPESA